MGKLAIYKISNINSLTAKQLKNVCEIYSAKTDKIFSPSMQGREKCIKLLKKLFDEGDQCKHQIKKGENNIKPTRFCFDSLDTFLCLENKLSPSTHDIVIIIIIFKFIRRSMPS